MTCSTGCWARYGELLAVQYSDPQRMTFHQLVVDTYAAQHPDGAEPRAVQSVAIHLMTLYLFVERDVNPALGTRLHRRMVWGVSRILDRFSVVDQAAAAAVRYSLRASCGVR